MKLAFAREHTKRLDFESQRFYNREVGAAVAGPLNQRTGRHDLILPKGVEIPIGFPVLIGEICHDLRSALDQLICELAIVSGKDYAFCEERGTSFPMYLRGPRAKKPPKGRDDRFKLSRIDYLRRDFQRMLDKAQPYHRSNGQRASALFKLHELNNTDKHRLVIVLSAYVSGTSLIVKPPPGGSVYIGHMVLTTGAKVAAGASVGSTNANPADFELRHRYQLRFGESCPAVEGLPVISTLTRMVDDVSNVIESFAYAFP